MNNWAPIGVSIFVAVVSSSVLVEFIKLAFARRPMNLKSEYDERERQRSAHYEAVSIHEEAVARILEIVDGIATEVYGPEIDLYPPNASVISNPRDGAGEALILLRGVRTAHPTKIVRDNARKLSEELTSFYGYPHNQPDCYSNWDEQALLKHLALAEELVEILHAEPPATKPHQRRRSVRRSDADDS